MSMPWRGELGMIFVASQHRFSHVTSSSASASTFAVASELRPPTVLTASNTPSSAEAFLHTADPLSKMLHLLEAWAVRRQNYSEPQFSQASCKLWAMAS